MSTNLILLLVVIFAGMGLVAWVLMSSSAHAWVTYKTGFTETAEERLGNMFLFIDPRKLFALNVIAIIIIPFIIYIVFRSPIYTLFAVVIIFALPRAIYKRLEKKRADEFEQALPDAMAQFAASMRAGSTLPNAMDAMVQESVGPISQEFSLVLREHRVGVDIDESLENLAQRMPSESLDLMIAASLVAREVGGNLAETFERLSHSLRQKITMENKIKALTSQGKMQGWVVGLLPIGMILILSVMEPEAISYLTDSLFGWIFIGAIVILECFGMFFIRKIVNIDV